MSRRFVMLVVAMLAVALVPAAAQAQKGKKKGKPTYGATTLVVAQGAADALESLNVTLAPIAPAKASGGGVAFPITTNYGQARKTAKIAHSGGLRLSSQDGSVVVELRNFIIDAKAKQLTALLGNQRVAILDLAIPAGFKLARKPLGPVSAELTTGAAQALNNAFSVTAFTDELVLGEATIRYKRGK